MAKGYSLYKAQEGSASIQDVLGYLNSGGRTVPASLQQEEDTGDLGGIEDFFGGLGLDQFLQDSSSFGSSWSATPVVPPVLDILAEMRNRRDSEAARAKLISDILFSNTPAGQEFYLGYEPGGIADVLLGIITGKGPGAAAGILPESQRRVRRQNVPIPGAEPGVEEEFGGAAGMAKSILDAIRVISTGGSQSGSQSASAPAPSPAVEGPSTGSAGQLPVFGTYQ